MMQSGLHVGLAAWINEQQNRDGFAVYPTVPTPTSLVDLGVIRDARDLAKAAEFARLVNFVPRQGQIADVFSSSEILWQLHREILHRMDHATSPWSNAEQQEYRAARDLLYMIDSSGMLTPSAKYLLFEEMRNAYHDLQTTGGSAEDLAQALAKWALAGHKQEVENALETISRLMSRSTRNQAEDERLSLDDVRLVRHADLAFAPTYFAPISAISQDSWLAVSISFAEIERAVGSDPASSLWRAFAVNRSGTVSFEYIVLNCLRPWFTSSLYQADDWRTQSDVDVVSQGNGRDGQLPAYVDTVYLVCVKDVTIQPTTPVWPVVSFPVAHVVNAGPLLAAIEPKSLVNAESVPGVMRGRLSNEALPRTGVVAASAEMPIKREPTILRLPEVEDSRQLKMSGAYQKITTAKLNDRFVLANTLLTSNDPPMVTSPPQSNAPQIYVAGFGCKKIPLAPNPNPNYQW
jgi:hypothetical protein